MKRYGWMGAFVAIGLVLGCGNLKKKEFLPQYEAYKAENAAKFQTIESSLAATNTKVSDLEKADLSLKEAIQDAKEEAMAAAEQGDADTLSAAKSHAMELDATLRNELLAAVEGAKKAAFENAAQGDEQVRKDVMGALENAKNSAMETLNQVNSKSASDMAALRAELNAALAKAKPISVATVFFASGKATLSSNAQAELDKALSLIQKHPNATVRVIGHADSNPILGGRYLTNLELSEARAKSVADYLKKKGVTNKMVVLGRGHFEPAGLQSTSEGKQASRRVEVVLVTE